VDRAATANQFLDQEEAHIAEIKASLRLTPDQEKNWSDLEGVLRDIAKARAERVATIRAQRAQQKSPVDIIERWRSAADILDEQSINLKSMADAAERLNKSLNEQ
jgi:hypothetical protein